MNILSINSGSSSLKITAFCAEQSSKSISELAVVQVTGIASENPEFKATGSNIKPKEETLSKIKSQDDAFLHALDYLVGESGPDEISSEDDIHTIVHRIVHGGDSDSPRIVDKDTLEFLEDLSDLAPLHNSTALEIVKIVSKKIPKATNIVDFDTTFHKSIPKHLYTYLIDPSIAAKNKLRRYGFHGISYSFITQAVAGHLQKPAGEVNIIALHLGSGASACCIKGGSSLDTSMGLTPVSGLPGATRSGDVDPSLVFHYTHQAGKLSSSSTKDMHITTAEEILNKKSGWNALVGTKDFGEIVTRSKDGDKTAQLCFDIFVSRVVGFVAEYYVKLGGQVDALVFSGGIGEKSSELREAVVDAVQCLGIKMDVERNRQPEQGVIASLTAVSDGPQLESRTSVLVCQTDEQLQMVRDVLASDILNKF